MKTFLQTCGIVTFGCVVPLSAQTTGTTTQSEVTRHADGSVTRTESTTTVILTPGARSRVVDYFEAFRNESFGLPPAWVNLFRVNEIPVAWRVSGVEHGLVVPETQRPYLVEAQPDLIKVLPAPGAGIRYYMAGRNVVAVDQNYKVLDSVQIPTVRFTDNNVPVPKVVTEVVPAERVIEKVVPAERIVTEVQIEKPGKETDDDDDD